MSAIPGALLDRIPAFDMCRVNADPTLCYWDALSITFADPVVIRESAFRDGIRGYDLGVEEEAFALRRGL